MSETDLVVASSTKGSPRPSAVAPPRSKPALSCGFPVGSNKTSATLVRGRSRRVTSGPPSGQAQAFGNTAERAYTCVARPNLYRSVGPRVTGAPLDQSWYRFGLAIGSYLKVQWDDARSGATDA